MTWKALVRASSSTNRASLTAMSNSVTATRFEDEIEAALSASDFDRAEKLATRYQAAAKSEAADKDLAASPWFRAQYLAAQVSLAAGRLVQVFERLEPLLPLTADLPPALACRLCLMSAEALARLKRIPEARAYLARCREWAAALRAIPLL